MSSQQCLRLSRGLDQTVTWVDIAADGSLVIEFYDHSAAANDAFGNDVAYLLTVAPRHKETMLRLLREEAGVQTVVGNGDSMLLGLIHERFASYFDLVRWLEARQIPFAKSFDGWA